MRLGLETRDVEGWAATEDINAKSEREIGVEETSNRDGGEAGADGGQEDGRSHEVHPIMRIEYNRRNGRGGERTTRSLRSRPDLLALSNRQCHT